MSNRKSLRDEASLLAQDGAGGSVPDAIRHAIAERAELGRADLEKVVNALVAPGGESLGDVRERLVASGMADQAVDRVVKAGMLARLQAEFSADIEKLRRIPGGQKTRRS